MDVSYKVIAARNLRELEEGLNRAAQEGWRLVAAIPTMELGATDQIWLVTERGGKA